MTSSRDELYALLRETEETLKQDQIRLKALEQEMAELKARLKTMDDEAANRAASSKPD
ncbi:MAG TPA: hypothetical protein VIL69_01230 [Roseomonas sp.]|jgi:septal ring factor EnvC (AmiA/AmiB activator)